TVTPDGRAVERRLPAARHGDAGQLKYDELMLLAGVLLQPLAPREDDRGAFTELFRNSWSLEVRPAQWNVVRSLPRVLRGVHAHGGRADYLPGGAGRAAAGRYDLRDGWEPEGGGAPVGLRADRPAALVVPPGVAHGFYFHEPSLHVYAVDHEWDPADEL